MPELMVNIDHVATLREARGIHYAISGTHVAPSSSRARRDSPSHSLCELNVYFRR